MRRSLVYGVAALLSSFALLAAEVVIDSFTGRSTGSSIVLEWRVSREERVLRYELERAAGQESTYRVIATIAAKGAPATYTYEDKDAPRLAAEVQGLYRYRLKIVGSDGSLSYSNTISVVHNVSGVRRTWGMIKEMFR
jgi:hypothetical protein